MGAVTLILLLLLAVTISGIVMRMLPAAVPMPFVQIALGVAIGCFADFGATLDPQLFLLLLVPPLLFLDGWRMPKDTLLRDARPILGLALGLVFLTVLGVGSLIHWLIPALPVAVAFAIAAVVSPTDPVAVSAIARTSPVPTRLMHVLEGEALLNDASGLVCLKFAIAAALSGTFSPGDAAISFAWMAAGGIASGAIVAWVTSAGQAFIARRFGEDPASAILASILTPFAAYLLAEHLHASGVLAAAAAGIVMTFVRSIEAGAAATRVRGRVVWDLLQFALNGVMFVLLGEQLPRIVARMPTTLVQAGAASLWALAGYVAAIMVALVLLRFCWVWLSLRLALARSARTRQELAAPPLQLVAATAVAGARGAITLAGVLTIPLALSDGAPFPGRDLAIFLAAGIIVLSLLVATIGLPLLLRGLRLPDEHPTDRQTDQALVAAAKAAIAAIETAQARQCDSDDADGYVEAAARMIEGYRERIEALAKGQDRRSVDAHRAIDRALQREALDAERRTIIDLRHRREIGSAVANALIRRFDLLETRTER